MLLAAPRLDFGVLSMDTVDMMLDSSGRSVGIDARTTRSPANREASPGLAVVHGTARTPMRPGRSPRVLGSPCGCDAQMKGFKPAGTDLTCFAQADR